MEFFPRKNAITHLLAVDTHEHIVVKTETAVGSPGNMTCGTTGQLLRSHYMECDCACFYPSVMVNAKYKQLESLCY